MRKASLLILLLCLIIVSSGCAGKQWRAAQQQDTIAGYAAFLEDHPHSWYADAARAKWLEKITEKKAREAEEKAAAEREYVNLLQQMKEAFNQWRETGDESDYRTLLDTGEKLAKISAGYDSPLFSTNEISDILGPPDEINEQGDEKKLIWKLAPQDKGIETDMSFSITVKW
jgi:hypothetical protein